MLTKHKILLGKGTQVESSRVREPRRTALPRGLRSQIFMVMALVSGLSLASHVVHTLFSLDDFIESLRNFCLPSIIVFALNFPVFHFLLSEGSEFVAGRGTPSRAQKWALV